MRVLAYATGILALLVSILALLIFSRYWNGGPNLGQLTATLVLMVPFCAVLWMVLTGWVDRHPGPALAVSVALFDIAGLAIGLWWIVGGACDLDYWLTGHPPICL
jgi:hypothetical protein